MDLSGPLASELTLMRYCGRTHRYTYLPKLTVRWRSKRELRGVIVEVNDGQHYATWKEFFGGVDWSYWETRQDPRCHNCKMHSGFEASVVRKLGDRFSDVLTMARC